MRDETPGFPGNLPAWVNRVAQDADGIWWGYSVEPLICDTGWYENEVGENIRLAASHPDGNWRRSLTRIEDTREDADHGC